MLVKPIRLLGKGVEGVSGTVMEEVDECVLYWKRNGGEKEGIVV